MPPCSTLSKSVAGDLGIPVDDGDMQALLDGPAQQARPAGRGDGDELGDLLGQEHVQRLGLEVLTALG